MNIQVTIYAAPTLGGVASLVNAYWAVKKYDSQIWRSKKSRKDLLAHFNANFSQFVEFIVAAQRLQSALDGLPSIEIPQQDSEDNR